MAHFSDLGVMTSSGGHKFNDFRNVYKKSVEKIEFSDDFPMWMQNFIDIGEKSRKKLIIIGSHIYMKNIGNLDCSLQVAQE